MAFSRRQNVVLLMLMVGVAGLLATGLLEIVSKASDEMRAELVTQEDIKEGWHYEKPPENTPIQGHWLVGMYPVTHYVVIQAGIVLLYGPQPMLRIETRMPIKWRMMGR